jgi:hypothetical protein
MRFETRRHRIGLRVAMTFHPVSHLFLNETDTKESRL